ncbi:hypothetical protein DFQ28_004832 [Apophysomyces sp. BC1034]|nr:hypothetical protein DFQ30_004772 [Apophysomyces sp. BC1015]KAG0188452.1 hypothetical protein DFQ28_004832 [Apophysomyces sp. BC1034]
MEKKETPTDIDVVHKEDTPSFQELPKETGGIRDEFDYEEEDLDMQIVNELATSEDDTTLVCFTFRSLFTGIILAILSASVSQLMLFKPVSVPLSNTFMMIVAYLICNAWANFLPKGGWLNPGPFNVKENTCIYVLVSAANTSAYGTFILGAQQLYYAHSPGALGGMLLLFSTQIVGYGIAGQLRPFLVYAPNVVWPQSLPTVSFLRTLNTDIDDSKWRTRFFFVVFGGIFVYEFIPQYMFPLLGGISVFCLGKRDSRWFERIFGGLDLNEGMGVLSLSFDWQFLSAYKPLVLPLYVQLNIFSGILIMWIVAPLAYYYNIWDAQKFPFLSNSIYYVNKTTGNSGIYPQEYVLNSDNSLNRTRFEEVGSPKYPTVAALQYVFINLSVTSAIMHVILYYGKDLGGSIRRQWTKKKADQEKMDVHMRLMLAYKEVPSWWYYAIYITGIALNILVAYVNHSQLPWWGVLFAIGMSSVLSLPLNFISAVTGTSFGLNVVAEMICGFVLQGYPVANIYFKTLGFNTMNQAGIMAMDLKIGHYLKVPPRMIFWNQMIGTVIGCIFNYIVNHSIIDNKRDILIGDGDNVWSGAAFHPLLGEP